MMRAEDALRFLPSDWSKSRKKAFDVNNAMICKIAAMGLGALAKEWASFEARKWRDMAAYAVRLANRSPNGVLTGLVKY